MTNRIYVYAVLGKDAEPWTRTEGDKLIEGTGLLKVGQTTKGTARARVKQQLNTAYPGLKGVDILFDELATRADGSEFSDHDVHAALVAAGITRTGGEWFEATLDEVKAAIQVVKSGVAYQPKRTQSFGMRPEQQAAVEITAGYFRNHPGGKAPKFLWNAKMRFGKTFTTYQLVKEMGWDRILVLTFKPAVATAWHDDLVSHVDFDGWLYVDKESSDGQRAEAADYGGPVVWFASLQDLGGRDADGHIKAKNEVIHLIDWDAIILDEYHFGAWRESARALYDPTDKAEAEREEPDELVSAEDLTDELEVKANHYLYLSGTPFRAITDGEFTEDAIFNWTYVDEQREKATWPDLSTNPYITLVAEYGAKLAATGDTTPAQAIGELINYLPIFGFTGGAMSQLDATAVLDWATAGVGAAALARRWNSPLLVNVNEHTLADVLAQPALMEALENVEDFRALVDNASQVITNTKDLKKAKREQGGKLTPDQKKKQSETAKRRAEIREKLQKFLAKIPVFMYATDYREEALKHVIESLDSALFERVTGLTVEGFRTLSDLGLFNAQHMNSAIYQFKRFESASLDYALTEEERQRRHQNEQIGLWDTVVDDEESA